MVWYGMVWYGMVWYGMYVCIITYDVAYYIAYYIHIFYRVLYDFWICDLRFDSDGSLVLCGPADHKMRRPNSFEGDGLCIMRRFEEKMEKHLEKSVKQSLQPLFEPDPEFSRRSTEEHGANQFSDTATFSKKHWMQEGQAAVNHTTSMVNHCRTSWKECDSHQSFDVDCLSPRMLGWSSNISMLRLGIWHVPVRSPRWQHPWHWLSQALSLPSRSPFECTEVVWTGPAMRIEWK